MYLSSQRSGESRINDRITIERRVLSITTQLPSTSSRDVTARSIERSKSESSVVLLVYSGYTAVPRIVIVYLVSQDLVYRPSISAFAQ